MKIGRRSEKCLIMDLNKKVSALARLKKTSISVKDIASQLWCEKQMELFIITGGYSTLAMNKGAATHALIQAPVFKALPIEPVTYADRLYKWAYETYTSISNIFKNGYCRELKIYGSINGFKISGQIDELRLTNGKITIAEDKTIKGGNNNVVSLRYESDKLQSSIYQLLLSDIKDNNYTFENFSNVYSLQKMSLSPDFVKGLDSIGIKKENQSLISIHKLMFESYKILPPLNDTIQLRYIDRTTRELISESPIKYSKEELSKNLTDIMAYWSGDREARPVSEENSWRCKMCNFFGKQCTTWWKEPTKT